MPIMPRPKKAKSIAKAVLKDTGSKVDARRTHSSPVADMGKDYTAGIGGNKTFTRDMQNQIKR